MSFCWNYIPHYETYLVESFFQRNDSYINGYFFVSIQLFLIGIVGEYMETILKRVIPNNPPLAKEINRRCYLSDKIVQDDLNDEKRNTVF